MKADAAKAWTGRSSAHAASSELAALGGEGVGYVSCRLCRRRFRTVNNRHLVRVHGFPADHPVQEYRKSYPRSVTWCRGTRRALSAALIQFCRRTRKVWTQLEVVRRIRELRVRGRALGERSVANGSPALVTAACQLFGGWKEALAFSGIDPSGVRQHRRWSRPELIRAIRSRRREGGSLAYRTVHLEDTGLLKAACRFFGTWEGALRAAGMDVGRIRKIRAWNPDKILRAIRTGARARQSGKLRPWDKGLFATVMAYFGSWRTALEIAGVAPRRRWRPPFWSREKVTREIRAHVREGGSLAWKPLFRTKPMLIGAALEAFGSWRAAVTSAGYRTSRPMTRQEWTRPELGRLIARIRREHGTVTPALLRRARPAGYASPAIHAARLFGSLEKALRADVSRGGRGEGRR